MILSDALMPEASYNGCCFSVVQEAVNLSGGFPMGNAMTHALWMNISTGQSWISHNSPLIVSFFFSQWGWEFVQGFSLNIGWFHELHWLMLDIYFCFFKLVYENMGMVLSHYNFTCKITGSTEQNGVVKHYLCIHHLNFDQVYIIGFIEAEKRIRFTGTTNMSEI